MIQNVIMDMNFRFCLLTARILFKDYFKDRLRPSIETQRRNLCNFSGFFHLFGYFCDIFQIVYTVKLRIDVIT